MTAPHDIPAFHPILTTDFFEFGTSTNNLEKLGIAVEMDDACLGLACSELKSPPQWACVRNASDPAINGKLAFSLQENCVRLLNDGDERFGDVGDYRRLKRRDKYAGRKTAKRSIPCLSTSACASDQGL